MRFRRSTAARSRWPANLRYWAGSQGTVVPAWSGAAVHYDLAFGHVLELDVEIAQPLTDPLGARLGALLGRVLVAIGGHGDQAVGRRPHHVIADEARHLVEALQPVL